MRWIGANSLAELVGLGSTLAIDFVIVSRLAAVQSMAVLLVSILLMTATGAIEGAVVALLQWSVIRGLLPLITRRAWMMATVTGAVVAWFFGSLPSTLMDMGAQETGTAVQEPGTSTVLLIAGAMGLFLGFVLGYPQWRVLRKAAPGAWLWIPANCAAWAVGMPAVFTTIDLAQRNTSLTAVFLTIAVGLLFTGAVVGAIHGLVLVRLVLSAQVEPGTAYIRVEGIENDQKVKDRSRHLPG